MSIEVLAVSLRFYFPLHRQDQFLVGLQLVFSHDYQRWDYRKALKRDCTHNANNASNGARQQSYTNIQVSYEI